MEYSTIMESTTVMFYSHSNLFHNNSGLSGLTDSKDQKIFSSRNYLLEISIFELKNFINENSWILSWTNQNDSLRWPIKLSLKTLKWDFVYFHIYKMVFIFILIQARYTNHLLIIQSMSIVHFKNCRSHPDVSRWSSSSKSRWKSDLLS